MILSFGSRPTIHAGSKYDGKFRFCMPRRHINDQSVYFTRRQFIKFICNVSVMGPLYKVGLLYLTKDKQIFCFILYLFSASSRSCICLKVYEHLQVIFLYLPYSSPWQQYVFSIHGMCKIKQYNLE